jgi:hypothetical protein
MVTFTTILDPNGLSDQFFHPGCSCTAKLKLLLALRAIGFRCIEANNVWATIAKQTHRLTVTFDCVAIYHCN